LPISTRRGWPLWRRKTWSGWCRCRHRAPPRQDRIDHQQRQRALALRDEFGSLAAYFWRHEPSPAESGPEAHHARSLRAITTSPESVAISKDLKKRGWSFVGPTTVYAFMQAMGLVNDHARRLRTYAK
jgi:3-methyladenine DNA glycosylase Tag